MSTKTGSLYRPVRSLSYSATLGSYIQKAVWVGSETLPTLALFLFVVVHFCLEIMKVLPRGAWRAWLDRMRFVLKVMLDRDFRWEHSELELLRGRLSDSERYNTSLERDLESAQKANRSLRDELHSQDQAFNKERQSKNQELERSNKQYEAQSKLLEETEAVLEKHRAADSRRISRYGSIGGDDFLATHNARIATLETRLKQAESEAEKDKESFEQLKKERDGLLAQVAALKEEKGATKVELDSANQQIGVFHGQREDLEARYAAIEKRCLEAEEERSDLRMQLDALHTQLENNAAAHAQELEALKAKDKSRQDKERADAADLVEKIKKESEALQERLKKAEVNDHDLAVTSKSRLEELEKAIAEQTKKSEELQHDVNSKTSEIENLKELLDEMEHKHAKLRKARGPQTPTPPGTLSAANALHPANLFGSNSPARARTTSEHRQPSASEGISHSNSILRRFSRDHKDKAKEERTDNARASSPTPHGRSDSPNSGSKKGKGSTRRRISSMFTGHGGQTLQ